MIPDAMKEPEKNGQLPGWQNGKPGCFRPRIVTSPALLVVNLEVNQDKRLWWEDCPKGVGQLTSV